MAMLNVDDFVATASVFPNKLYRMVCDSQCQCMNWGGEGEHLVLNTRLFEDELLQQTLARWKYQLKTTSTTSFIRQLHAYGFRKVVEGFGEPNNIRRYYHPYFHRNHPHLLTYMKRSIRSSNPKKVPPIRIYEDTNKQPLLMTPMFNHQLNNFDKINFNFEMASPQTKMDDGSQTLGENSNKRRRKAPPKKHPSFEENTEWEESTEYSPPSMVTRSQPTKSNQSQGYSTVVMEFGNRSIAAIEQGTKQYFPALSSSFLNDTKVVQSTAAKIANYRKSIETTEVKLDQTIRMSDGSECNLGMLAKSKIPFIFSSSQKKRSFEELIETSIDEPLDLSQNHCKSKKAILMKNFSAPLACNTPTNFQPSKQSKAVEAASKTLTTYDGDKGGSAFEQGITEQSKMFASNYPLKIPGTKSTLQNLPSISIASGGRISIPPNSVLQPAYIAWPTRGIFCPQTKQWIQPRPTIIPLPFKNQMEGDCNGKPGFVEFKLGENGSQITFNGQEPIVISQENKELPSKCSNSPCTVSEVSSPLDHTPNGKEM